MLRISFFVGFAVVAAATAEPPAAATELVQGFEPSETWTEEDFKSKEMSRLFTGGTCRCDSFRGNCEFGNRGGSFIGRNGCSKGYQPTCGGVLGICYCLCKSVPACTRNGKISKGEDCLCGSSGEETGQICEEGSTCTEFDTIGDCPLTGARYHHYNPYNTAHGTVSLAACKEGTVIRSCLCGNEDCNPGDECFFPVRNRGFCVRQGARYHHGHYNHYNPYDDYGFDPPAAAGFGPPGTKDTCDDLNRHCGRWATTGGSTGEGTCEDPDPINYMQEHCKKSCGLCGFDPPVGFGPGAKVCAHNEPVTEDCFCERPVGGEYCEAGGFCAAGTCYRK